MSNGPIIQEDDLLVRQQAHSQEDLKDLELCKEIGRVLCSHYPAHPWHISVDSSPNVQMVDIKVNYPDKLGILPKFGYKMRLSTMTPEKIMRAGGELLERYNLARAQATPYAMIDAIKNGCDKSGIVK